jgi:uncharacterized protein (TIGR02265 family)
VLEPGNIIGSSHQGTTLYLERTQGPDAVDRVYAAIDAKEAEVLRKIRAKDWCPLPAFCHYMLAADEMFGHADLALCREIGNASARWQIPGIVRLAMRLFSPLQMLNHIPTLWSRIMDRGRVESLETGPTSVVFRLHEFDPFHRGMCERLAGFIAGGVELTGGREPSVAHTRCVTADNLVCEYAVSWLQRRPTLG